MSFPRARARRWLAWSLVSTGVSAAIAVMASLLQAILSAGGDAAGAAAVRGVLLVSAVGFLLSLFTVTVLLALLELFRE
jgi:hypothetical protein